MLVLSRRVGETVVIGDNVAVTVLSVAGGRTRLGIQAPRNILVERTEISRRGDDRRPPVRKPTSAIARTA